jgi:hypothetical protein
MEKTNYYNKAFLLASILLLPIFLHAQLLHDTNCSSISTNYTLDWDESPSSNQFNWTPSGATSYTASNIQGSGNSISFSVTGATGTLDTEGGKATPSVNTTLSGGADALHISSSGLDAGEEIVLTMTFSPALAGDISFDIYNIREQVILLFDDPGQQIEVYGLTSSGYAIVPELSDNGSPSWELEGPGVIDGNATSTAGTNDQVGVNFRSISDISSITVILRRCSNCDNATNTEFAIGDIDICLAPDTDQDGIADTQDEDDDNDGIYDVVEKCPTNTPVTAEWDNMTYLDGDPSNTYNLPDGTNMTVAISSNGASVVAGETNSLVTGGQGVGTVGFYLNGDQNLQANSIDVSFSWDQAIKNLSYTIFDVDRLGGQYVDSITIIGFYNGFVVFPVLTGSSNVSVSQNRALGELSTADSLSLANVDVSFSEPIDSMIVFYGNGATAPAAPGNQWITIWDLTYIGDCGSVDSDADGIADYLDIDSDNDGIVDYIEWQATTASPIAPSGSDGDNDGIDDNFESVNDPVDTDGDGRPDFKDPDSDDDGDLDVLEAYDTDNDGTVDTSPAGVDTDGDGLDDNYDNQSGLNPTTNVTNNGQTSSDFPNLDEILTAERDFREDGDIDDDGIQDYADLDDENDGILDTDEGRSGNDPTGDEDGDGIPNWADTSDGGNGGDGSATSYTDTNADGIPDVYDVEQDGIPNHHDPDSDGDGIADMVEAGGDDSNGDGLVDGSFTDTDGDGWSNTFDSDNGGTALSIPDTDSDGYLNFLDIDADADGVVDIIEAQATGALISPAGADDDKDGIDNNFDTDEGNQLLTPVNSENFDLADYIDPNSDNDLDSDNLEAYDTDNDGLINTSAAGADGDEDGLDDNFDNIDGANSTTNITNSGQTAATFPNLDVPGTTERDWREKGEIEDQDGDGIQNSVDIDDDNDGILDSDECEGEVASLTNAGTGSYTVSEDGLLSIRLNGGDGGGGSATAGGSGATVCATYLVTAGDVVRYVVGAGSDAGVSSAGGAGSTGLFINNTLVLVAGGGGGGDNSIGAVGLGGSATTAGADGTGTNPGAGGSAGAGGGASTTGSAGGGGINTAGSSNLAGGGQAADLNPADGVTLVAGGAAFGLNSSGASGFTGGGGGAAVSNSGGGGGYSGGGAAGDDGSAGGGGSYLNNIIATYVSGSVKAGEDGGGGAAGENGEDGFVELSFCKVVDNDNVASSFDLDSDGDGIADIVEAGGTDIDGDGTVDGVFLDTDGDGWSNVFDPDNGGTTLADEDRDNDGLKNRVDIDSDGDGIVDIIESQQSTESITPSGDDADLDGIDDNFDTDEGNSLTTPEDTDGDALADFLDSNTDNDIHSDVVEAWDIDNDGVPNTSLSGVDSDGDGLDNSVDNVVGPNNTTNITNGGQNASTFPNLDQSTTTESDWRELNDFDEDRVADEFDLDKDNDGILDTEECNAGEYIISGGDGGSTTNFSHDNVTWLYIDFESVDNALAIRINGAAINVNNTLQLEGSAGGGEVALEFVSDSAGITSPGLVNSNNLPRLRFVIDENGFISLFGTRTTSATTLEQLQTGDGSFFSKITFVPGSNDFSVENTDGSGLDAISAKAYVFALCDWDGDGSENYYDKESDGDGLADIVEAGGEDADGDGRADNDTDSNNDGIANLFDSVNGGSALVVPDTDSDGQSNYLDLDSDSDGLSDNVEAQLTISYAAPSGNDTDNDGWDDAYDADNGGSTIVLANSDGTGNPDYMDTDSDDDSFPDCLEGFDDNTNGDVYDDFASRAENFELLLPVFFYINTDDTDADGIPDWLEDDDGDSVLNFLDADNVFYHDTDQDGLIDLFDTDNNGLASTLPDGDGDGEYDFRDVDSHISLPILLVDFQANKEENRVSLLWSTEAEVNNDYFTIERSGDGKNFKKLLQQKGAGNSTVKKSYHLYDETPLIGYNYYRLSQTDFDGTTSVYPEEVVYFDAATAIKVYPTIGTGERLFIELRSLQSENFNYRIIDGKGKLLKEESLTVNSETRSFKQEILQGLQLAEGMYFLQVFASSEAQSFQFIISK